MTKTTDSQLQQQQHFAAAKVNAAATAATKISIGVADDDDIADIKYPSALHFD